jgi:hypothetical protein
MLVAAATPAAASADPVQEGAVEQSCRSLQAGTAGTHDLAQADGTDVFPATWPEAPPGLLPAHVYLRGPNETYNRRFEFATRGGQVYGRPRDSSDPWRQLPLPLCFAGRVASIALDDDEMIALDDARRVYTMDNALKDPSLFNWTNRWGTPFWTGPGYTLPGGIVAWSWSVISPVEDKRFTDPAGNHPPVGSAKVSHIWALRDGGRRLTFWDPWLPLDESYEMCGPLRGRFEAVNLSASGSEIFVIGRHGDLFTRLYDFDLSGHDAFFMSYSYDDQRGKGDSAPVQLPAAQWVMQPKIPGRITSTISVHKTGVDAIHRILRVEGRQGGSTGYWQRDVADPPAAGWKFHATGATLTGHVLDNPARDSSRVGLGAAEDFAYRMTAGGMTADLLDFNPYCPPAHLRIREGGTTRNLLLHSVDALRQQVRARGLDDTPREQYGAIEGPPGRFETVTVKATTSEVVIPEKNWTFKRVPAAAPRQVKIRVSPRRGRRTTTFVVSFRSPVAARYTVDVAGPPGRCDLQRLGPGRRWKKGAKVRVKLDPDIRGWCRGRYRVTVEEVAGPSLDDRFTVGAQMRFRVR